MNKIIIFCILSMIIYLFPSCENKLTAEIPAYIEINHFDYIGNNNTSIPHPDGYENYQSVNIVDAWISMDGQIIGNFEIPCKVPILIDDNSVAAHTFDIYPGIKVNGISGTRRKYPFYEPYITNIILNTGEDLGVHLEPKTRYKEHPNNPPKFEFKQNGQFEFSNDCNNGTMFEKSSISDTTVIMQNNVVFQGNCSAAIYLDSTNTYFDVRNIGALDSLTFNTETFLELNFMSNINFNVGLIILSSTDIEEKQELIQLYPTEEWKKIYLDLSPLINMGNSMSTFKIYFEGNYDSSTIENSVYLDNLKLVFYR